MKANELKFEAARYGIQRPEEFQHFRIETGLWLAAKESLEADVAADPTIDFIETAPPPPLPAPRMTITIDEPDGETTPVFLERQAADVIMSMCLEAGATAVPVRLTLKPGRPSTRSTLAVDADVRLTNAWEQEVKSRATVDAIVILRLLDLIAEPRLTRRAPDGPRQARRAAQRRHGIPADAWTLVTWELGRPVNVKNASETDDRRPLHYRRGHYRRALPHHEGAVLRRRFTDGRLVWVKWIEGYWAGHPAFGVRRSVHAPRAPAGLAGSFEAVAS